ncbi:MAG: ribonuclease P protein component [Anaerococcus hydrogenalis]|nr:ribonuclease P protein component [Anaerococcus hydrogenalis]
MEKQFSLRKNVDFERVYKKSKHYYNRDFTVFIKNNGVNRPRFGFSISKKVGKANQRNKLKRRLRSIVYENQKLKSSLGHVLSKAFKDKKIRYVK